MKQIGKDKRRGRRKRMIMLLAVILLLCCGSGMSLNVLAEAAEDYTDVAVLSTTDMHGKCWETNVLTGGGETANMLRVSDAVSRIREEYGSENVILIDNGDLFQEASVSEIQLADYIEGNSEEPPVMALCLKEIGYDVFVLGNHEFNFEWNAMRRIYDYLEDNGITVLAANIYYDGKDGVHAEGENVFTPYTVREITVNGHPHKIGILGLENMDIPRWDQPDHYPGMMFARPDNESFSASCEAEHYIRKMREEGCEFIIVSYHSGLGEADHELKFGENTDNQGLRMIEETEGLGLVILGHDHSNSYSGAKYPDRTGTPVPVVNGGGQELTKTVFRFSEDADGNLTWELLDNENLSLKDYNVDEDLAEKVRPYAKMAMEELEKPIGFAGGEWDESTEYYTTQTDTIDLINMAQMDITSGCLQEKYGMDAASAGVKGLDHLDVDMSMTSVAINGHYVVKPESISIRDVYKMYRFNNTLYVLPLSGRQIRAIMEENAKDHITARVYGGEVHYFSNGSSFTNIIFGGMNFTYDMAKPEGERVIIRGFSNGRPFEEDRIYLTAVSNYLLSNEDCGLRDYGTEDAVWAQTEEASEETVQDIIAEYIIDRCEEGVLTTDPFIWDWCVSYSADPDQLPPCEAGIAAKQAAHPEEGHIYVIYQEASGNSITGEEVNAGLGSVACEAYKDALTEPLAQDALRFMVQEADADRWFIKSQDGRYLSCASGGGLFLSEGPSEDDLSLWELQPANGGWYIVSARARSGDNPMAVQYFSGRFTTFALDRSSGIYVFNFYEIE